MNEAEDKLQRVTCDSNNFIASAIAKNYTIMKVAQL